MGADQVTTLAADTPAPPPGFTLESAPSVPTPPLGFAMENAPPKPPAGFAMESPTPTPVDRPTRSGIVWPPPQMDGDMSGPAFTRPPAPELPDVATQQHISRYLAQRSKTTVPSKMKTSPFQPPPLDVGNDPDIQKARNFVAQETKDPYIRIKEATAQGMQLPFSVDDVVKGEIERSPTLSKLDPVSKQKFYELIHRARSTETGATAPPSFNYSKGALGNLAANFGQGFEHATDDINTALGVGTGTTPTITTNPERTITGAIGRGTGGVAPGLLASLLGPEAATAAFTAQGFGSGQNDTSLPNYASRNVESVERGLVGALIGEILPGAGKAAVPVKGLSGAAVQALKGTLEVQALNVGQAGVESLIRQSIGVDDPGLWETIKAAALNGEGWAQSIVVGGIKGAVAYKGRESPQATPEQLPTTPQSVEQPPQRTPPTPAIEEPQRAEEAKPPESAVPSSTVTPETIKESADAVPVESPNGKVSRGPETPQVREGMGPSDAQSIETPRTEVQEETNPPAPESSPQAEVRNKPMQAVGAAHPESGEFDQPGELTSIKNRMVEEDRKTRGLPPLAKVVRRVNSETWDRAMEEHHNNRNAAEDLEASLKASPRPHTDREVALLTIRELDLKSRERAAEQELIENRDDDSKFPELHGRLTAIREQLQRLTDVTKSSGTETARGLQMRRIVANEGYTLEDMQRHVQAAQNGEPLTPKQEARVKEAFEGRKKAAEALEAKEEDDSKKRIQQTDLKPRPARDRPKILEGLKNAAKESNSDNIANWIRELYKTHVEENLRLGAKQSPADREAALIKTHEEVTKIIPDWTKRKVQDAISGYGEFRKLSQGELNARVRQYKQELQLGSKIEDLQSGKAPKKSGMERQIMSDEGRSLNKQVGALIKKLGIRVTDPATQLKSAVDAMKTRLRNQIADMELAIANRKPIERPDGTEIPKDDEGTALASHRDALKKTYDDLFKEQEPPKENAELQRKISQIEKQIAENTRRIAEGDLSSKSSPQSGVTSPELEALREHNERLNKTLQQLRREAIPPKTQDELDTARIKSLLAFADKQVKEYERQVSEGDIWPTKQAGRVPTSPELEAAKARVVAAKAMRDALRDADTAHAEAIKTKELQDSIEALKNQLAENDIALKEKEDKSPDSPEIAAQRTELQTLRNRLEDAREAAGLYDEQRIKDTLARLEESKAAKEKKIRDADVSTPAGKPSISTPEIEAAKAQVKELDKLIAKMKSNRIPKMSPELIAYKNWKARTAHRIADYADKIRRQEFGTKPKTEMILDPQGESLKAEAERYQQMYQSEALKARMAQRPGWEKGLDLFGKFVRGSVLSGPTTLLKLASASVEQVAFKPLYELAGTAISYTPGFKGLSRRAASEGGSFSVKGYSNAFVKAFTKGMADAYKTLRDPTHKSELDLLYGKEGPPASSLEFFGWLHGAEKALLKRFAFEYSLNKRAQAAIRDGLDVTDPVIQTRLGIEAYKDSQREIFQGDYRVTKATNAAIAMLEHADENGETPVFGKIGATGARTLLPVAKVGTNLVAQTFEHVAGLEYGLGQYANAVRKGISNLEPAKADEIMRHLKKGSVGSAALLLGYFAPQIFGGLYTGKKEDEGKPKHGTIAGIPSIFLHNPLLEVIQFGATIRHVADSFYKKEDENPQGLGSGVVAAVLGLIRETPVVNEVIQSAELFDPQKQDYAASRAIAGIIVPQALQQTARLTDSENRKPVGIVQNIEAGIPGLRQKVPTVEQAAESAKTPQQQTVDKLAPLYRTNRNAAETQIRADKSLSESDRTTIRERGRFKTDDAYKLFDGNAETLIKAMEAMTPAQRRTAPDVQGQFSYRRLALEKIAQSKSLTTDEKKALAARLNKL